MNTGLRRIREALTRRFRVYRANRARARSSAIFIGITGSSGKSTSASLLGRVLASHGTVHTQVLANTMKSLVATLYKRMGRAGKVDYVVFEAGAYGVDTIRPMAEMLKPHVAVVTMVRLEHFASFRTLENVAREKRALIDALEPGGLAVLNADDPHVMGMASGLRHRFITFGVSEIADYRVSDVGAAYPDGLALSIHWRSGKLELKTHLPAEHFWLPVAAAVATALELGVPKENVQAAVATFQPLLNRCEVVSVEGGPRFIVDSAKAPWHSINLALEMIAKATVQRKRIVLGQISDYGGSTRKYAQAYTAAREIADEIIYTGDNAHRSRAPQADRECGRFVELRTPKDVSDHIKKTAVPGELILLKSAPNLHLERVALAWKHDVKCWIPACGKKEGCQDCGLFEVPFEEHREFTRNRRLERRRQRFRRLFGG
ncbi:UDP-N-acetylmuramoyl-tripeptide--D-alanyl-D-alanine ligase [Mesorhizobium sp. M3A.F.Ca.ET.080.04.2.1]|uniref:Mur ligase family protein n=1 Tax=Mesorhizobium sp. M3A.F.Ca.ET.080.04.2.1 TaxID=2493676 RepID=UPI000F75DAE3|nr:Mur ligase family protein [Mesorhizobium sp. M3A.F.Ca.ET.080.04.2.1]AZO09657.1 UDP-N-acetylmuramoyl-tripeptide--D-alanyl-D-alanine ligase [Mesorhizobium sp. M3A.F.Ca.ET.080.04.2.1]RWF24155.1 MAG: UDP-N-acetylmuramoyl-tripeptide--D-alanyl-D-alanine ligase [Mesorhizobium sp.]TGT57661.1 UDP-N-acetylmuramoyl-tripeptide--D-alanyl-D-alanine ligase [Mesorhizobium sp. M00.F.Ca.ET.170.01.1.1]